MPAIAPAQQTFFAYLGIRDLIAKNPDLKAAVNRKAMSWLTTHHAPFASTFVGLGRIFDEGSAHNLDRLLKMIGRNLTQLGRDALRQLKEQFIALEQAAAFVEGKKRHHRRGRPPAP